MLTIKRPHDFVVTYKDDGRVILTITKHGTALKLERQVTVGFCDDFSFKLFCELMTQGLPEGLNN